MVNISFNTVIAKSDQRPSCPVRNQAAAVSDVIETHMEAQHIGETCPIL